jgi:hypothetical protein
MATPKADQPRCDVYGCGIYAAICTDGTEVDETGAARPAIKNLNVCAHHKNWAHSEDAKVFTLTSDVYKARK